MPTKKKKPAVGKSVQKKSVRSKRTSTRKIQPVEPLEPEIHESLSRKEKLKRETEKARLLQKLRAQKNGSHVLIHGKKVGYIEGMISSGKVYRVYGDFSQPHSGCLIRHADAKWRVSFDFHEIGIRIPTSSLTSQLKDDERRGLIFRMHQLENLARGGDVKFLADALESPDSTDVDEIAKAIKGLWRSRNRSKENEKVICSIGMMAQKMDDIPTMGEVRDFHAQDRPPSKREPRGYKGEKYSLPRWNQTLTKVGFSWLPAGRRGSKRTLFNSSNWKPSEAVKKLGI